MINVNEKLERQGRLLDLLDSTVTVMEQMCKEAKDDNGEERAFTAVEQYEFDELTKIGNILKKLVTKHDLTPKDCQALLRTAFIGGK